MLASAALEETCTPTRMIPLVFKRHDACFSRFARPVVLRGFDLFQSKCLAEIRRLEVEKIFGLFAGDVQHESCCSVLGRFASKAGEALRLRAGIQVGIESAWHGWVISCSAILPVHSPHRCRYPKPEK